MNDNNLNQNNGTYKATANLNTAIDNPQINVNSATGVNVQDLGYNNYVESTNQVNNITNDSSNVDNINNTANINSGSDVSLNNNNFVNNNVTSTSDSISSNNVGNDVTSNVDDSSNVNYDSSNLSDVNNTSNFNDTSSSVVTDSNKVNYTYAPTLEEKKIKKESIISILFHSKEFKALIFIVFILCLFLLVMPVLYDLMRKIQFIH